MPKIHVHGDLRLALAGAAVLWAAYNAHAASTYGDAGEQVYLSIKLENVQISSYQLGVLDSRIARTLAAANAKYTPAEVSAASREAASKLKSQLGGKKGTAKVVVCMPSGPKTCVEISCQSCSAE